MGEEKDHRKRKCLNHTANSARVRISAWVCPASGSMPVSAALHSADSIVWAKPEASSQPGLWWQAFSMERWLWVRITGDLVSTPGCWQGVMGQGCQPWSSLLNFLLKFQTQSKTCPSLEVQSWTFCRSGLSLYKWGVCVGFLFLFSVFKYLSVAGFSCGTQA